MQRRKVNDDVGATQTDELTKLDGLRIEMVKPQLSAHCPSLGQVGERTSGQVVDHFHGKRFSEHSLDEV
jgi:hypothetical protein